MIQKETPRAREVIKSAIAAAGGSERVAAFFRIKGQGVRYWAATGKVPAERIKPLCDLGGNTVTPETILTAITREADSRRGD